MARTHIDRLEHGYPVDSAFLAGLSADAADETGKVPSAWRWCAGPARPQPPDPWYRFNLSRHRANAMGYGVRCSPGDVRTP